MPLGVLSPVVGRAQMLGLAARPARQLAYSVWAQPGMAQPGSRLAGPMQIGPMQIGRMSFGPVQADPDEAVWAR